jgi:multidrug efflux pump subunit AcrA (membrane-fusion protein)
VAHCLPGDVGASVVAGDVVARLDARIAMNTARTAEADLSAAKATLARITMATLVTRIHGTSFYGFVNHLFCQARLTTGESASPH